MSKTHRDRDRYAAKRWRPVEESFRCGYCHRFVGAVPSGGRHRNHCPYCLYSRHVDGARPGDRASTCRALMEPQAVWQRRNGEVVLIHRCVACHFERSCRIAADDDVLLLEQLPVVAPPVYAGGQPPVEVDERTA